MIGDLLEKKILELEDRINHLERLEKNFFSGLRIDPGDIVLYGGSLYGITPANIADDDFMQITPTNDSGIFIFYHRYIPGETWGIIRYRVLTSVYLNDIIMGSPVDLTWGTALTGTTGTDGRFTVAAHTDGDIYLENRTGGAVGIHYLFLGG